MQERDDGCGDVPETVETIWTQYAEPPDRKAALFQGNFDAGRKHAEEHMERMLSHRDMRGCPCLSCRRGGRP